MYKHLLYPFQHVVVVVVVVIVVVVSICLLEVFYKYDERSISSETWTDIETHHPVPLNSFVCED